MWLARQQQQQLLVCQIAVKFYRPLAFSMLAAAAAAAAEG
jgi:hypothetical protein